MSYAALIITYHAVEAGPPPLCLHPELFRRHLDCVRETGATTLTVSELAAGLRAGRLPERAVALTFDDGFASVSEWVAPLLLERGLRATVFCVGAYVGRANDWPGQPPRVPRRPLAGAADLAALARAGFEIGAHGMEHRPLDGLGDDELQAELAGSRDALARISGTPVCSLAYPYGIAPRSPARALVKELYTAACTTRVAGVASRADPYELPRVDAHYLRRPALLQRALTGSLSPYLAARRVAAQGRRLVRRDYARPG